MISIVYYRQFVDANSVVWYWHSTHIFIVYGYELLMIRNVNLFILSTKTKKTCISKPVLDEKIILFCRIFCGRHRTEKPAFFKTKVISSTTFGRSKCSSHSMIGITKDSTNVVSPAQNVVTRLLLIKSGF